MLFVDFLKNPDVFAIENNLSSYFYRYKYILIFYIRFYSNFVKIDENIYLFFCFFFCFVFTVSTFASRYVGETKISWKNIQIKEYRICQGIFIQWRSSKAFDFIYRGKMCQTLVARDSLKETVTIIIVLCKDIKSMVRSPNTNTVFFRHYISSLGRRYIGSNAIHILLRLYTTNVNRSEKLMVSHKT